MNVSVAIKLSIARFINSSVILVVTNTTVKYWFNGGSLAQDAMILVIIMAISNPIVYLLDFPGIINKLKKFYYIRLGDECKLT